MATPMNMNKHQQDSEIVEFTNNRVLDIVGNVNTFDVKHIQYAIFCWHKEQNHILSLFVWDG